MNITCCSGEQCQAGFADNHCGIVRLSVGDRDMAHTKDVLGI